MIEYLQEEISVLTEQLGKSPRVTDNQRRCLAIEPVTFSCLLARRFGDFASAVILNPFQILVVRGRQHWGLGRDRAGILPRFDFGMPIRKRETSRSIVVRCRYIRPGRARGRMRIVTIHQRQEIAVVN